MFAKNEALDAIQKSNAKLVNVKTELFDKCDKLSKEILLNESRWDFLLKIQVDASVKWHFRQISMRILPISELLLFADGRNVARRK